MDHTKITKKPTIPLIIIVMLLLCCLIVGAISYEKRYDIVELPFNSSETINIIGPAGYTNYSIELKCTRTINLTMNFSNCLYSSPNSTNLSFFGNNQTSVKFSIDVPAGSQNNQVKESWKLYLNRTQLISNFSIDFKYNISLPTVPRILANVNITSITPSNNTFLGQFDSLPSEIKVEFDGNIDYSKSNIKLKYNNSIRTWITQNNTGSAFTFKLGQTPDGLYTGNWFIVDMLGHNKTVNYRLEIKQTPPPAPMSISPDKGEYVYDVINLRVLMDTGDYQLYYLFKDGYAPLGSISWKLMSYADNEYRVTGLNMGNVPIGALYLKIVDKFGNIRIHPTGIISGPGVKFDLDTRSKNVEPGDTIVLDVDVNIKPGSGQSLYCKMDRFVANEDDDDETDWPIRNTAWLQTDDYDPNDDDKRIDINDEYDEALNLGSKTSDTLELVLLIPRNALIDNTYESRIDCIMS